MLDNIEEETFQRTMKANVILTFSTVISEFGTQEIFNVEFAILSFGEKTVLSMLLCNKAFRGISRPPKRQTMEN